MSTERTILSPFTKEYRVLAAHSGIRLFLEGLSFGIGPYNFSFELYLLLTFYVLPGLLYVKLLLNLKIIESVASMMVYWYVKQLTDSNM